MNEKRSPCQIYGKQEEESLPFVFEGQANHSLAQFFCYVETLKFALPSLRTKIHPELEHLTNQHGLKILHQNVRGFFANHAYICEPFFIYQTNKTLIRRTNTTTVPLIAGKDTKSASFHNE